MDLCTDLPRLATSYLGDQQFTDIPGEFRRPGFPSLEISTVEKKEDREQICASDRHDDDDNDEFRAREKKRFQIKAQLVKEEKKSKAFIRSNHRHQKSKQDTGTAHSFMALLKVCAKQKDLRRGGAVHADIVGMGLLQDNVFLGNALISMYVKCGSLVKAHEVCDELPVRNVVSWNAIIAGYAQYGYGDQALKCFEQMQVEGVCADSITYVCILQACGSIGDINKGQEIHAKIVTDGSLGESVIVGTALVDMYFKCGLLTKAQEVFDELPVRDTVLWGSLITGYCQHKHGVLALKCFEQMQMEGLSPDAVTFVCILKACSSVGAIDKGQEIHAQIVREGFLEKDVVVGNALVDMYAKFGMLSKAQEVFDELPIRNVVSWNVLITGYAQHGCGEQALESFDCMQFDGLSPDALTMMLALKACGSIGDIKRGQEIHAKIIREGLLEKNAGVGISLVDMYAKCGLLAKAHDLFDKLPRPNVILWNALIAGYMQHGCGKQALKCFQQMQLEGHSPNAVTYASILKACGSTGAIEQGQKIHLDVVREGLLETDITVANALVDMYAKCGLLAKAQEVFDKLPVRDVVSWSALIVGYTEHGYGEQSLQCFEHMQLEDVSPDAVTFLCILKACGSIGAADKGQQIHDHIVREGLLEKDIVVGTVLVDMYAKCGLLAKAHEVFDKLSVRNSVTWNALIAGYAILGMADCVFDLFEEMTREDIKPDLVTFNIILNVCNHAGLVVKGQVYFDTMRTCYDIIPTLEHYSCMVNLFARAGHLEKAVALIKEMPYPANLTVWHTVLGACKKWGNLKLGRLAFEHAVQLDEKDSAAYVCMYNIYSDAGRHEDAEQVEALRMRRQAGKKPTHFL